MKNFLRENWPWIVAPLVLVLGVFAFVVLTQDSDPASDYIYTVFGD